MKAHSNITRWIYSTITTLGLAGFAGLCQAQSAAPIVYNFANSLQGWAGNEPGGMAAVYSWNATNGSTGGGCMQVVIDGVTTTEMDPIVTLPATLDEAQYLSVSIHMMIDPNSGTLAAGGYGNLQAVFRNAGYSWDSIWYGGVYPPAANSWTTITFIIPAPYQPAEKYLQFQLQGSAGYSGPLTNYIDNITITPLPDPYVMDAFTSASVVGSAWDPTENAPFDNPITGTVTNFTPAGSWEIQIANPNGYSGWNQYQPSGAMNLTRFQYFGLDVYLDGSTGPGYGGAQILFFQNGWASPTYIGGWSFNSSMVGKWTHFNFASAAMGANFNASPAFAIQGTPGSDDSTNTTTFHVDNLIFWSPATLPKILSLNPGTPGGAQMTVDADGTANQFDQEGISAPATNCTGTDFFWINQTPATYSFSLTNFPAPSVAPGFDSHVYIVNGTTIENGPNDWGYNQTYSGIPWNAVDYAGLRIQNSTSNNGVVAIFEWKTNSINANATNTTTFYLTQYPSANGTWTLTFSDNTDATLYGPDGHMAGTITLPDFSSDPNYTGNFSPADSLVQFGVAKNDANNTGVNNDKSAIFTQVLVTNASSGTLYNDSFSGPGLTANYAWQVAEYYLDAANRIVWQPQGTAWWVKWNTSQAGWSVLSTSNLLSGWSTAGATYTYVDVTGTNTLGAIPSTNVPAGNAGFFRLTK